MLGAGARILKRQSGGSEDLRIVCAIRWICSSKTSLANSTVRESPAGDCFCGWLKSRSDPAGMAPSGDAPLALVGPERLRHDRAPQRACLSSSWKFIMEAISSYVSEHMAL